MKKSILLFSVISIACSSLLQAQSSSSIRNIDFKNRSYPGSVCGFEDKTPLPVKNGVHDSNQDGLKIHFEITKVIYGDLNGDASEEALVMTLCNTGGTGQFTDGTLYSFSNGEPKALTNLGIGDRADGGIQGTEIKNGILSVTRFGQKSSGACCPEFTETQQFKWKEGKLVAIGNPIVQKYQTDSAISKHTIKPIQFEKGKYNTTLKGNIQAPEYYSLYAKAGQIMTLQASALNQNAVISVFDPQSKPLGDLKTVVWSQKLPQSGPYKIEVAPKSGSVEYSLNVIIK